MMADKLPLIKKKKQTKFFLSIYFWICILLTYLSGNVSSQLCPHGL